MVRRITSLSGETYVQLEFGLQTVNETTILYIRRGYETPVYDTAIKKIKQAASSARTSIHVVTQVIFGLPGDSEEDMLSTVEHAVAAGTDGIKCTVLYVLKGTDLADDYAAGKFSCLEENEYFSLIAKALSLLPPEVIVHRLTGDGPKNMLVAPLWTCNKRRVQNDLMGYFKENGIRYGENL
jgi:radical SAM protein (TIGR01212 family)